MKRFVKGNKKYIFLILLSLLVAILSHMFFISEWFNGRFMTGVGDGVSQMLPFKQLLYDEYTSGNFFYSKQFGMGGGTYSQLSYYFSTSIFFIGSVIVTFGLEKLGLIVEPDLFYWANTLVPISIIRVTLIIFVTTLYFKYLKINDRSAFIGAVIYGTSVIYFRHVAYWEFFADAMLWLPILLYGIEKIIREKQVGWFIFAIALNFFDNFYFSYINILLATIYIVFRWIFTLTDEETKISKQISLYVFGGIIGLGISAVSLVPAVYGYLNNHRIPYEAAIPIFGTADNPLLDGRIIVIPTFVVLCLFLKPLYEKKLFKFFAGLTIVSIILHFSPIIASVFNGFSAPQYRWEYFLALVMAGVVAVGLEQIRIVSRKNIITALSCSAILYLIAYFVDPFLPFPNWQAAYLVFAAIATCIVFASLIWKNNSRVVVFISIFLLVVSVYTSNFYQSVKLSEMGGIKESSYEWMHSDAYIGADQTEIIKKIQANEKADFYRIDWMTPTRNNTPIVQQFNGFSVYSSILNKHLLYFYLNDLEIDMGRESVSRYGTLGNRAYLASLLAGKYYIAKNADANVPYGFDKLYTVGDYTAYENTNVLPFVRTTKTVYAEADFVNLPAITKERAMIDGIILKESHDEIANPPLEQDIIEDVTVKNIDAVLEGDILEVTGETGGIDLIMDHPSSDVEDYYVTFELKRLEKNEGFNLSVNEYTTSRKKNSSIYKTGVETLTIRVSAADKIAIRLPKGKYELTNLQVYEADYEVLRGAKRVSEQKADVSYVWSGNKVALTYDNQTDERYMTLPIPFEKGWRLFVNGKKQDVLQANYAFIGLSLEDGVNDIKLVYYPPYFWIALMTTLFSIIAAGLLTWRKRKTFINQ